MGKQADTQEILKKVQVLMEELATGMAAGNLNMEVLSAKMMEISELAGSAQDEAERAKQVDNYRSLRKEAGLFRRAVSTTAGVIVGVGVSPYYAIKHGAGFVGDILSAGLDRVGQAATETTAKYRRARCKMILDLVPPQTARAFGDLVLSKGTVGLYRATGLRREDVEELLKTRENTAGDTDGAAVQPA
jgi:hypothetical protein